ncbi:MAG: endonuclease III domain-containing protein [Candidatus Woesearchaeota archaeon]
MKPYAFYKSLLEKYGLQGWWPLLEVDGCNPTKTGSCRGYHPGDYSYPKNLRQRFEICIGSILTQNVGWINVEKALLNLSELKSIEAKELLLLSDEKLKEAIKPAGYYNQKAKKLRIFAEFFEQKRGKPTREELLSLWGIGEETADSMLLYAYSEPTFVVDTYTRRIFDMKQESYGQVKEFFERNLPKDYRVYQEYHALLVEHAKVFKGAPSEKKG